MARRFLQLPGRSTRGLYSMMRMEAKLSPCLTNTAVQQRSIFNMWRGWMTAVWNRHDDSRENLVGPDRLAAEWMLRNGGAALVRSGDQPCQAVQAKRSSTHHDGSSVCTCAEAWYSSYNRLPWLQYTNTHNKPPPGCVCAVGLVTNADQADVTDDGLQHVSKLRELTLLSLKNGSSITDNGLEYILPCKSIQELDLTGTNVTAAGVIAAAKELPHLRKLTVSSAICEQVANWARSERPGLKVVDGKA